MVWLDERDRQRGADVRIYGRGPWWADGPLERANSWSGYGRRCEEKEDF